MPVPKLVITMAQPLILSLLVQSLYNIVDGIFVGRISEEALPPRPWLTRCSC